MTLLILDPALTAPDGERFAEAAVLAREAASRGQPVILLAAQSFAGAAPEGMQIRPFFAPRAEDAAFGDPLTGRLDAFAVLNDALALELARIPRTETRATDAVVILDAGVNELAGYLSWMKGFDPLDAPLFLLRLAGPRLGDKPAAGAEPDPLLLRLALRVADWDGPPVQLLAAGRALAKDWTKRAGRPVEPMPLPVGIPALAALPGNRIGVLAPGDSSALREAIAAQHPGWTVLACDAALPEALDLLLVLPWTGPEPARPLWEALARGVPMLLPRTSWMAREAALWGEFIGAYPATASTDQMARQVTGAIHRLDELCSIAAEVATRFRAANGAPMLMDRIGLDWSARIAAAALLVRERETTIDLARLQADGWHKLEQDDGVPMRWTGAAPQVDFDWPFRAPWQMRLRLRSHRGEDQLRGIEAWCGEARLPLAVVQDSGVTVLRIDGVAGDPRAPRRTLRLRLPFTWQPPDDPRDLGVLVTGIALRALQPGLPPPAQPLPSVAVRAPAEAGGGWSLQDGLSGELVADASRPVALSLRFDVPGGAETARGIVLHLNGAPLRLDLTPAQGTQWDAVARVPPALLRSAGLLAAWDIEAPLARPPARLLEIGAVALAATQGPAPPPEEPAPEPATRRGKWWRGGG